MEVWQLGDTIYSYMMYEFIVYFMCIGLCLLCKQNSRYKRERDWQMAAYSRTIRVLDKCGYMPRS